MEIPGHQYVAVKAPEEPNMQSLQIPTTYHVAGFE